MEDLGLTGCKAVFQESLVREMDATAQINTQVKLGGESGCEKYSIPKEFVDTVESYLEVPATRSRDRDEMSQNVSSTRSRNEMFQEVPVRLSRDPEEILDAFPVTRSRLRADTTITTPAANGILSGDRTTITCPIL
jgi:hypothetical protein